MSGDLSVQEKNHLWLLGEIRPGTVIVIREQNGHRLLQGERYPGDLVRGWLIRGEGIPDVEWAKETMQGWPESVL